MTAPRPYRVLVTGSRDWDDVEAIWQAFRDTTHGIEHHRALIVVHGDCPRGADWHADRWATLYGATIERHPADWQQHGKAAGFRRNAEMAALGADLCLAFIRNGSRGASHTADLAEKAGIPVRRWTA